VVFARSGGGLPDGAGFGFFACVALLSVFLGLWPFLDLALVPFLELLVVYSWCPCAGRHLLSLPPQRKISKESG
jgi:hypothetical protein